MNEQVQFLLLKRGDLITRLITVSQRLNELGVAVDIPNPTLQCECWWCKLLRLLRGK